MRKHEHSDPPSLKAGKKVLIKKGTTFYLITIFDLFLLPAAQVFQQFFFLFFFWGKLLASKFSMIPFIKCHLRPFTALIIAIMILIMTS